MFKHRANGKDMAYNPMEYNPNGKDIMTPMEYTLKGYRALFLVPIPHVTSHAFLRHYGGQLKTAVEPETGEKIDCKR